MFWWILLFSLLGGVLSILAASVFLLIREPLRTRLIPHIISFAIGALLGAAFLALLPHAVEPVPSAGSAMLSLSEQLVYGLDNTRVSVQQTLSIHQVALLVLLGILGFFLLEKMVLWRHCHSAHCAAHVPDTSLANGQNKSTVTLILIGDAIHNLVDGVVIAAAFLTDFHLGLVTTLALAAHEIPQEVGDFAILLNSGMSRRRAFFYNTLVSLTTVAGALIAFFSLSFASLAVPYVLAVAASSFIYIAVADLIPGLHEKTRLRDTLTQLLLIGSGVALIYLAHTTLH